MTRTRQRRGQVVVVKLLVGIALGGLGIGGWYALQKVSSGGGSGPKFLTNSLGMKFALVPKGAFTMGSPKTEADRGDDEQQHEAAITQDFVIGIHEVTQGQYQRVMGNNPSCFTPTGLGKAKIRSRDTSRHPVECVTWHQAVEFCKKLGALAEEKEAGRTYRLPTEAEWEYACRAGTTTALHLGDVVDSSSANFNGLSPYGAGQGGQFLRRTAPVGEYPANKLGLHDMHGNVMEWCSDWYDAHYFSASPKQDPPGPATGKQRVTRGGCWSNSGKACRSAVRTKLAPDDSHYGLGFRVVMVRGK
ncbi:MAG: formylglycine-generating enzyme family protein [Gemmataceae bacterium]|nr:formylglycine-generating enzyme family protein [Gemmataceae bacterium]